MTDTGRLREAVEFLEIDQMVSARISPAHHKTVEIVLAAARRLLAVEESAVPLAERIDYEAAQWAYFHRDDHAIPWESKARMIVDAALGDISDAVIALSEVGNTSPLYPGEPE
jgi:hypothetical protein